jgi:2'-5' RNA ligase
MRLFIAIPLPPDITRALSAARVALEAHGATGRLVPRENYHITLHFLGDTDALKDITDAMRQAVRDIKPFVLRLKDYGSFKTDGSHTGFVNVTCDSDELNRLYESLESALWERGFSKNRGRLTPHVTLGRKIEGDEGFMLPPQKAAFTANTIILYESHSERGQMVYSVVHKESLL